jgi:hypothetical protein
MYALEPSTNVCMDIKMDMAHIHTLKHMNVTNSSMEKLISFYITYIS